MTKGSAMLVPNLKTSTKDMNKWTKRLTIVGIVKITAQSDL